jgi:hypothetical protein
MSEPAVALICGSRDWPAPWFVTSKLIELVPRDWSVLTGGARGVDEHAHREAVRLGYQTKVMSADWERFGKRAGFMRNDAMLNEGPSLVLAFNYERSKGTAHTIRSAYKRGIDTRVFTEADLPQRLRGSGTVNPGCPSMHEPRGGPVRDETVTTRRTEEPAGTVNVELSVTGRWAISYLTKDWSHAERAALVDGDREAWEALRDAAAQQTLASPDDVERDSIRIHMTVGER